MPNHRIPQTSIDQLTADISDAKRTQVATLQNYIQELLGNTHHTFLQGSYRNRTAISDIPDVDIVAVRTSTYSGIHSPYRFDTSIPWAQIFSEISTILRRQAKYQWTITEKDKCIKIEGSFNADVVPAVKVDHDHSIDPIVIRSSGLERKSYPRQHIANGEAKHAATSQQFKPTVRMFKNWAKNHFGTTTPPVSSFQIEAMVYALPDQNFSNDPVINFINAGLIVQQLLNARTLAATVISSVCGSENIVANWNLADRNRFSMKLSESLLAARAAYQATTAAEAERNWRRAFNT